MRDGPIQLRDWPLTAARMWPDGIESVGYMLRRILRGDFGPDGRTGEPLRADLSDSFLFGVPADALVRTTWPGHELDLYDLVWSRTEAP